MIDECICGSCRDCRRTFREEVKPPAVAPSTLSRRVLKILGEPSGYFPELGKSKAEVRKHRRVQAVQNRRRAVKSHDTVIIPPTPTPCVKCGEMRALRQHPGHKKRGSGLKVDGYEDLCTVCHERPALLATIEELEPLPRTGPNKSRLQKARCRVGRITKDGRPFHPSCNHGTATAYSTYGCMCQECRDWKAEYDQKKNEVAA